MKVGDKVRFLSEVGGGVITGFSGKDLVLVEDEDGFEIGWDSEAEEANEDLEDMEEEFHTDDEDEMDGRDEARPVG